MVASSRLVRAVLATGFLSQWAGAAWIAQKQHGNKAWFLHSSVPRVQSFDLQDRTWSKAKSLAKIPSAFDVDDSTVFVGSATSLLRFRTDGTGDSIVATLTRAPTAVFLDSGLAIVANREEIRILRRDGSLASEPRYPSYLAMGLSHSRITNTLHGASYGVSPADIGVIRYDDTGAIFHNDDSPYHGDFPIGSRTWISPSGDLVVDDAGVVYSSPSLTYLGSLGFRPDEIAFRRDGLMVLRVADTVFAIDKAFRSTGRAILAHHSSGIVVTDSLVFAFRSDDDSASGIAYDALPLAALGPADLGEPLSPVGLAFEPTDAILADRTLFVLSSPLRTLFRWDLDSARWARSIALQSPPSWITWADSAREVFLCRTSGQILSIDPASSSPVERPFAALPMACGGVVGAGWNVLGSTEDYSWEKQFGFDRDGRLMTTRDLSYALHGATWSAINQAVYHFRDGMSPNDLYATAIGPDGRILSQRESPYHGEHPLVYPIRVSPDGNTVVLGSGEIWDASSLTVIDTLEPLVDVAWLGSDIYTLKTDRMVRWKAPTLRRSDTLAFRGKGLRLWGLASGELLLLRLDTAGVPRVELIPADLSKFPVGTRSKLQDARWTEPARVEIRDLRGRLVRIASGVAPGGWREPSDLHPGAYRVVFQTATTAWSRSIVVPGR